MTPATMAFISHRRASGTRLLAGALAKPPAPRRRGTWAAGLLALGLLAGCASTPVPPRITPLAGPLALETAQRLAALMAPTPADVLVVGEQHDAAQHQQIQQAVIGSLAARGLLAAVALEMADAGVSTAQLDPSASEGAVRAALKWNDTGWPWAAYGPVVMTAVRAGVPVLGANLPRADMKASMANAQLDQQLPGPALQTQQQLMRAGHCHLLPEAQILPMTRIQIARDMRMADTAAQAVVPGKVVVLVAGSVHADRKLGIPRHVPAGVQLKSVRLQAGNPGDTPGHAEALTAYDAVWHTPAVPAVDYCADLKNQRGPMAQGQPAG